ncbi:MAG TPA: hypothetical protein VNJ03_10960 [Vicinamibacterales bacterium]|nr:hypothetical protein [Vicinamibacterales bacterium]
MDDSFDYCREVEAYLCKKNEGHLVRIVGPAFEQVRRWADEGIPLKVAFRGIDQTCERHAAKGQRRRPLRIEFCEADVLHAFDDWRRAIGAGADRVSEAAAPSKGSLVSHIERTVSRLLAGRRTGQTPAFEQAVASTIAALDELGATARQARGDARAQLIARLSELDRSLLEIARVAVDRATSDALRREVNAELAAFLPRMPGDARERAIALAYDRLLRDSLNLPIVTYE